MCRFKKMMLCIRSIIEIAYLKPLNKEAYFETVADCRRRCIIII